MGIESIVNVVVTAATATVTQQGFGTPLILGTTTRSGTDRVRYYSTLASVAVDYANTTPEYLMAQRIFSQSLRPARVAIGKRLQLPTQRFTLTPTALNSTRYAFQLGGASGPVVEYVSDSSASLSEITAGLAAAFAALDVEVKPTTITVTDVGPGTSVRLQGSAAGVWNSVEVLTPSVLSIIQDSTDAGVTTDLDALQQAQPDWYGVLTPFASQAEVMAIAAWVEANRKLFFYASTDRDMWDAAYDPDTADSTVGGALKSRNYARSLLVPAESTGDFADAGALGYFLATQPGGSTLHLKGVVGVSALTLTPNQQDNLLSYNANPLVYISGLTVLQDGKTAAGNFVDLVRDTDWLVARIQESVLTVLAQPGKVPYTDEGVSLLTAAVAARAQDATTAGFLAEGWKVSSVPVAQVSVADKAARRYPAITLTANYAGAVHTVDPLTVTLSV